VVRKSGPCQLVVDQILERGNKRKRVSHRDEEDSESEPTEDEDHIQNYLQYLL
jgi:hypothetical protein